MLREYELVQHILVHITIPAIFSGIASGIYKVF